MFLLSLCVTHEHPLESRFVAEYKADKNRKFEWKRNSTNAFSMTLDIIISMFVRKQYNKILHAFDNKTREIS